MKIIDVQYKEFQYSLKSELKTSSNTFHNRNGIVIKISTDEGILGFGEASPLFPFGNETFIQAQESVERLKNVLIGLTISEMEFPFNFLEDFDLSNSIRFAVEQCLTEIFIKSDNVFFDPSTIHVNGLISLSDSDSMIQNIIDKGYNTVKIKIGKEDFSYELEKINSLIKKTCNDISFRFDVNGGWDLESAIINIKKLGNLNIEYIEQPCRSIKDLVEISKISKIPIAADESFMNLDDFNYLCEKSEVNNFILKPTLYGGIAKSIELINRSEKLGKSIIISTAIENVIANNYLLLISSFLPGRTHGLGTVELISPKIIGDKYSIKNGIINFNQESLIEDKNISFDD